MMRRIKDIIRRSIPDGIKKFILYSEAVEYGTVSFSQFGEDLLLKSFFGERKNGFYVDVGAHHPFRFSNTYQFYKEGWRGINIEPMPESKKIFDQFRPRDINIEVGISDNEESLNYYEVGHPAANTFSSELLEERNDHLNPKKITKIRTYPLSVILDQYKPIGLGIDFLNIDVEGYDLKVLKSNDWNRFRPTYVLVEDLTFNINALHQNDTVNFLKGEHYSLVDKCGFTLIFKTE